MLSGDTPAVHGSGAEGRVKDTVGGAASIYVSVVVDEYYTGVCYCSVCGHDGLYWNIRSALFGREGLF